MSRVESAVTPHESSAATKKICLWDTSGESRASSAPMASQSSPLLRRSRIAWRRAPSRAHSITGTKNNDAIPQP